MSFNAAMKKDTIKLIKNIENEFAERLSKRPVDTRYETKIKSDLGQNKDKGYVGRFFDVNGTDWAIWAGYISSEGNICISFSFIRDTLSELLLKNILIDYNPIFFNDENFDGYCWYIVKLNSANSNLAIELIAKFLKSLDNKKTITNIIIDLKYKDKIFKDENVINQDELYKITNEIEKRIKSIKEVFDANIINTPITYNSILISGSRGAGKTSFLFSLRNKLKENTDIEILDFLDPTLIEEKAHIFFTIISLIKSKVEEKFNETGNDDDFLIYNKKSWYESLNKLAKGLPLIDGACSKTPDFWDDATHILNKALDDVNSSFELRKNFEAFLRLSLEILNKKVFLLFIDDVDTKFDKSWSLLETIRKYLATKYIITILTGDFDLFSMSIRKHQWENFGKDFIGNETKNNDEKFEFLKSKITDIEAQYIEKILPVQHRYSLHTFKEILEDKTNEIKIKFVNGKEQEYRKFYKSIFNKFGLYNSFEQEPFESVIQDFPVRTQMSLLRIFANNVQADKEDDFFNIKKFDVTQFVNLFVSYFAKEGMYTSSLTNSEFINIEVLKFLIKNDALENLYQLQLIDSDKQKNIILFVLNFVLCYYMNQNKALVFENMYRIGYLRNILFIISVEGIDEKSKFIDTVGLFQTKTAKVSCSQLQAELFKKGISNNYGSILIENGEIIKKIFEEINKSSLTAEKKALLLLPTCFLTTKEGKKLVFSFYNLIGCINDILVQNVSSDSIERILKPMCQIRSYIIDDFEEKEDISAKTKKDLNKDPKDETSSDEMKQNLDKDSEKAKQETDSHSETKPELQNDSTDENTYDFELDKLFNSTGDWQSLGSEISIWKNSINNLQESIAVHVLNKVSTRIFYSFKEMHKNYPSVKTLQDVIELMNLFVCELFHAAIIEEYNEAKAELKDKDKILIDFNNLQNDTKLFRDNLDELNKIITNNRKYFPLTQVLLSCPILLMFIDIKNLKTKLSDFYKKIGKTPAKKNKFNYYDNNVYSQIKEEK